MQIDLNVGQRAQQRRLDASDADGAVIRAQLAQDTGPVGWPRLDASLSLDVLLRTARGCVPSEAGQDAAAVPGSSQD